MKRYFCDGRLPTLEVALTTYQILTWRSDRESEFSHLELFRARSWRLLIADES